MRKTVLFKIIIILESFTLSIIWVHLNPTQKSTFTSFITLNSSASAAEQFSTWFPPPGDTLSDTISTRFLTGKFEYRDDTNFTPIPAPYALRSGLYMRTEALHAFIRMYDAAAKDSIKLTILSAVRNFSDQDKIWESKWSGKVLANFRNLKKEISDTCQRAIEIMKYSSLPGTSRHHWGTDIDLVSFDPRFFYSIPGLIVSRWLRLHAAEYGFCQPYTPKGPSRVFGYEEEKWHWSYMPLASKMLNAYIQKVSYSDISGFSGAGCAASVKAIERYVMSINSGDVELARHK